jgi:hypothetical protein
MSVLVVQPFGPLGGIKVTLDPRFVFRLKGRGGTKYEMTMEAAERDGLSNPGSLFAHTEAADGWRVKVYYRKQGENNQAISVIRLPCAPK